MARRQLAIAGTERTDIPEAVLEAGEEWLDKRKAQRRAVEKAKESKFGLIALMQSNKIPVFVHRDSETGEYTRLKIDLEPKLSASRVKDAEADAASDVDESPPTPDVHPGLIAKAQQAQADNGIEENAEGDVVVPDEAAPKKKRGGKGKGK
jgi:hypothetical protein